jgi:hypothetical protein
VNENIVVRAADQVFDELAIICFILREAGIWPESELEIFFSLDGQCPTPSPKLVAYEIENHHSTSS